MNYGQDSALQDRNFIVVTTRQILAGLTVAIVMALGAYLYGLGAGGAVTSSKLELLQQQVNSKVGKEEFQEFRRSVDDMTQESRLLRSELEKTREDLAALRAAHAARK